MKSYRFQEAKDGARSRPVSQLWPLCAIGLLYVSFGIAFGFLQGGIPPIMRARGTDLRSLAWVFALYLPFGLTFLWAPAIDAFALPRLPRRIGWIIAAQTAAAGLTVWIAFSAGAPPAILFSLGMATAFCIATMDIALDALAVEIIPDVHRTLAGAAKVGALAIGTVIGGGALVGLFAQLGWLFTFLTIAATMVVCAIPVITLAYRDRPRLSPRSPRVRLSSTVRDPLMRRRLIVLAVVSVGLVSLFYFNRVMLVDLGVPLERIGWIIGTLAPLVNLAASVVAPVVVAKLDMRRTLWCFLTICLIAAGIVLAAIAYHATSLAIVGVLTESAAVSAIVVVLYTVILRWADGKQAATDYAALYGFSRLAGTIFLVAIPQFLPVLGWQGLYGLGAMLLLVGVYFFDREVSRGTPK